MSITLPTVVNNVVVFFRVGIGTEAMIKADYDKTPGGVDVLDKVSGKILKDHSLLNSMHGGIAIVDSYLLFRSG